MKYITYIAHINIQYQFDFIPNAKARSDSGEENLPETTKETLRGTRLIWVSTDSVIINLL